MDQLLIGLANAGVAGAVLAWVLVQMMPQLKRIEGALDRLTRAQMLDLVSRPDVPAAVKRQAREVLAECGVRPAGTAGAGEGGVR